MRLWHTIRGPAELGSTAKEKHGIGFPARESRCEGVMALREHVAYVPYANLVEHFHDAGGWTCVACGGRVEFRGFGHEPRPRVPLFECAGCGRRSDGCQTFEAHHLLYDGCALEDEAPARCGHWLCEWALAAGTCPVCGARKGAREYTTARSH